MSIRNKISPEAIPSKADEDILTWLDQIDKEMIKIRGMVDLIKAEDPNAEKND